ncbi:DUF1223 domain-containing protein [Puniceibacterium confluentis]|uniref:DUF1223 domain-containing protein n=1 Tax=Puniceibacterium confluentis TaxID=1958944 RepID=UPI001FE596A9|nr:DUF1223 domain-containing protein [Puniceibacterium confluentis]
MRHLISCAMGLLMLAAGAVSAQQSPVVVELFTSQGCSSCPPADALLADLDGREDVIPLALHVDYWDYIGWKDKFASPAYTTRQKGYAAALGNRSIYTPQMIVNGRHDVVGNRPKDVAALIKAHKSKPSPVSLQISRSGDVLSIRASSGRNAGPMEIAVARYKPHEAVVIQRGENAGRTIDYSHIVTGWAVVERWNGQGSFAATTAVKGTEPIVVLVQGANYGPIFAAARLR